MNVDVNNLGKPFEVDDLQVEFVMLDPYIRRTLTLVKSTDKSTRYTTTVKLPDRYGYFTLRVYYKRYGYTYVDNKELIVIRHLAHDEYDRFIPKAGPYYIAYSGLTLSLIVVCYLWLFQIPEDFDKKNK